LQVWLNPIEKKEGWAKWESKKKNKEIASCVDLAKKLKKTAER